MVESHNTLVKKITLRRPKEERSSSNNDELTSVKSIKLEVEIVSPIKAKHEPK